MTVNAIRGGCETTFEARRYPSKLRFACLALLGSLAAACGSSDPKSDGAAGKGTSGSGGMASASGGSSGGGAGKPSDGGKPNGGTMSEPNPQGGDDSGLGGEAAWRPTPMPLISRNVPAFSSGNEHSGVGPEKSNDDRPDLTWVPDKLPGWLAYDLSGVPEDKRQQVLIAWYAAHQADYIVDVNSNAGATPIDYTIEINAAPGGGMPPADGWKQVASETGNPRSTRQYVVDLNGGNWVRMTVSKATNPTCAFDLDVHSAPDGSSDSWLFMGDSITHTSLINQNDDIPKQVNALDPARWPSIAPAAIGGTNTNTALEAIDETMKYFPGKFVVLAYGTNNHPAEFTMEPLLQKVLAAGKIPVIPHIPWADSDTAQREFTAMNAMIDDLYEKYPQIVRGPDFWEIFKDRLDLIPTGDVHPTGPGQIELRKQWAAAMAR